MARILPRIASATALLSTLGMVVTPAAAAPINAPAAASAPVPSAKSWSIEDETVQRHRRGYGRYGGWYGRRHRGTDAGDVLAGVLIIGGIAAIASAASRDRDRRRVETRPNGYPYRTGGDYRDRDYRDRDGRYPDGGYRDRDGRYGSSGSPDYDSRGLGNAADMCTSEVGRTAEVDRVDAVDRTSDGWRVTGSLRNGRNFSCSIDNNGRIRGVDMDSQASVGGGQWDDDAYARARADQDTDPDA